MDPYFFYNGFSDRGIKKCYGCEINENSPVGDYYSWLGVETARTGLTHGIVAKLMLFPALIYFFSKRQTKASVDTLCMGYHVLAKEN